MRITTAIMAAVTVAASAFFGGLEARAAPAGCVADKGAAGKYLLMAEGDSITFGVKSSDGQTSYVPRTCVLRADGIETIVAARSRAVLGSPRDLPGTNSLFGRMRDDNAVLAAKRNGRVAILSVLIGRNDLVGYGGGPDAYADDLAGYIRAMRRAGWDRVIVGTLLPSTWEPFDGARDGLTAILRLRSWRALNGVDALADFAGLPVMGPDGAAANTAFYADGIHPTDRGYETMAPVFGEAVRAVVAAPHR